MRFAVIFTALAGGTGVSSAASILTVYTSVNGQAFAPGNQSVVPGDVVRARYVCATDNPAAVGLAGFSFFPLVINWKNGHDLLAPWTPPSGSQDTTTPGVNGPGVRDHDAGTGRLAPFAASASTAAPTAMFGTGTLRISGTGTAGRVAIAQNVPQFSSNPSGNYFSQANPVPVFQFSFTVGTAHDVGSVITIDGELTQQYALARWYDDLQGSTAIFDGAIALERGTLTVVPTPGVLALVGAGGAWGVLAARRRRG